MPMSPRLLRPRATGTFSPKSIPGLQLWLDASDTATLGNTHTAAGGATDNGPVKYWGDKSGNGYNATRNAADTAVPTLLVNNQQGKNALRFDGGDWLTTPAFAAFPNKRGTILVAMNNRKETGYGCIGGTGGHVANNTLWGFYLTSSGASAAKYFWFPNLLFTDATFPPQTWLVTSANRTADTAMQYRVNGVAYTSSAPLADSSYASAVMNIGANGGTGERLTGDIGEVLLYNRSLSDAERLLMERYLGAKWGVTL